jgi:hypothetical protein
MATPAVTPAPPAGAPPGAGGGRAVIERFRQVAQQVQMLGQQYPETADIMSQILPMLVKAMSLVAGNPSRTPPTPAPPIGG